MDESSSIEKQAELRGEAYCFAKVKQDEIVMEYGKEHRIPYVIIRPGVVYGPGKKRLTGRVGIGTFGVFLHLGGFNTIPLTYVDNCAEAIVLAGLRPGIDGEVFNVVDDNLLTAHQFLKASKKAKRFQSIRVPYWLARCERIAQDGRDRPVPFGRAGDDPERIAGIELGREMPIRDLFSQVRTGAAQVREWLEALEPEAWQGRGEHPTAGVVDLDRVMDEFVVGHLEEHAEQLEVLAAQTGKQ